MSMMSGYLRILFVAIAFLFSTTVFLFDGYCNLFSVLCDVIFDVSCNALAGYKSREIFLSFCFFCTAYRAAQIVTTISTIYRVDQ
jgi:hypothetical protein